MPDETLIETIIRKDDWNEFRVVADGPDIEIFVNGVSTAKYLENQKWVPPTGHIFLQAHSGGPYQILYKDIRLRKLEYKNCC
jgi:hypothetical protein